MPAQQNPTPVGATLVVALPSLPQANLASTKPIHTPKPVIPAKAGIHILRDSTRHSGEGRNPETPYLGAEPAVRWTFLSVVPPSPSPNPLRPPCLRVKTLPPPTRHSGESRNPETPSPTNLAIPQSSSTSVGAGFKPARSPSQANLAIPQTLLNRRGARPCAPTNLHHQPGSRKQILPNTRRGTACRAPRPRPITKAETRKPVPHPQPVIPAKAGIQKPPPQTSLAPIEHPPTDQTPLTTLPPLCNMTNVGTTLNKGPSLFFVPNPNHRRNRPCNTNPAVCVESPSRITRALIRCEV